jgi:elongation factor P
MSFFHERPVDVTLPTFVQLDVTATEPGVDGNTAAGDVTMKATVETGAVIRVPLFIRVGDSITIDTRTHGYVERVGRLDN